MTIKPFNGYKCPIQRFNYTGQLLYILFYEVSTMFLTGVLGKTKFHYLTKHLKAVD